MRPKSIALLLLALGCGLVASIGVTRLMTRWSGPADSDSGYQSVFVASTEIGTGELVTPDVVKLEQWPTGRAPKGSLAKPEELEGRRTRSKLYPGEPILDNKLFAKGSSQQGAAAMIPVGYRLATVRVDPVTGGANMLLPGDRVDLMIHMVADPGRGVPETVTRTILQDVKVFAVNDEWSRDKDKEGNRSILAKTISLLATPEQAAKVTQASQMGTVHLMPRGPEDDRRTPDIQIRPLDLFGKAGKSDRAKEEGVTTPAKVQTTVAKPVLEPSASDASKHARWTIRVIKPGAVDDIVLESDGATPATGVWKPVTTTTTSTPDASPPSASPQVKDEWKPVEPMAPPAIQPPGQKVESPKGEE